MIMDHVPVLLDETLAVLAPQPGDLVIDATFGAGGHSRRIADAIGETGTLIAIDRDPAAHERFDAIASEFPCATRFVGASFAAGLRALHDEGVRAEGILFDLGVSSPQIDDPERGFSYSRDAPLDMRMDPAQEVSAETLVNELEQHELVGIIRRLGEERHAGRIAAAIVRIRAEHRITTTGELAAVIADAVPAASRNSGGHPAKRSFQALRIAVNEELEEVDLAIPIAWEMLQIGGRLAVISFHSLEDRRVKKFFAPRAKDCICPPELPVCRCGGHPEAALLTSGASSASDEELDDNPRARSAKLRGARKLTEPR